jgi:hypothetical protein
MDRIRSRCHRERDRQLMSRPCLRQFVPAERELRLTSPRSETPQGKAHAGVLYGPKAKTPHREKSVGPRSPNIDLFLPDSYRAVPEWEAARAFRALDVVPVDLHPLPLGWKGSFAFRPASHQEANFLFNRQTAATAWNFVISSFMVFAHDGRLWRRYFCKKVNNS